MQQNKFGEMIFNETDVCDLLMQGRSIESLKGMLVDSSVDIEKVVEFVENFPDTIVYRIFDELVETSLPDWDALQQHTWFMPDEYSQLDIAQYILNLCTTEPELQRCGEELLLYQERNLFPLLQYLFIRKVRRPIRTEASPKPRTKKNTTKPELMAVLSECCDSL